MVDWLTEWLSLDTRVGWLSRVRQPTTIQPLCLSLHTWLETLTPPPHATLFLCCWLPASGLRRWLGPLRAGLLRATSHPASPTSRRRLPASPRSYGSVAADDSCSQLPLQSMSSFCLFACLLWSGCVRVRTDWLLTDWLTPSGSFIRAGDDTVYLNHSCMQRSTSGWAGWGRQAVSGIRYQVSDERYQYQRLRALESEYDTYSRIVLPYPPPPRMCDGRFRFVPSHPTSHRSMYVPSGLDETCLLYH